MVVCVSLPIFTATHFKKIPRWTPLAASLRPIEAANINFRQTIKLKWNQMIPNWRISLLMLFSLKKTTWICFFLVQKVVHLRPVTSLCEQLCVFMLFLCLQLSLCLNPPMPCEFGHSHQLGSALPVPSTPISEHRSLCCDQRSPPRIIYQLLWCSLPDVIL